jgi:hypothetical protein
MKFLHSVTVLDVDIQLRTRQYIPEDSELHSIWSLQILLRASLTFAKGAVFGWVIT